MVALEPSINAIQIESTVNVDTRAGDEVSGELFITTTPDMAVLNLGDEIIIDFTEEPLVEG